MRIAQIISGVGFGGAELVLAELTVGLKERGHDLVVISLLSIPADSPSFRMLREHGIDVHALGLKKYPPWRVFPLRRILGSFSPDIAHAHLFHAHMASRFLGRSCKIINTYHGTEDRRHRFWQPILDARTQHLADVHSAVSAAVADRLPGREHRRTVVVVPNGMRPPRALSAQETAALREAWGAAGCTRVIGSAGRLVWHKGYDLLVDALPTLSRHVPAGETWALVLLGDGPMRDRLEAAVREAPANIRVSVPGFTPEASTQIGAFDVFVLPSRSEGFGLAAAEAMAHGLPTVTSPVGGLPELLAGYPNGHVVPFSDDPAGAAERIAAVVKENAVRTPVSPVPIEEMIDSYLDLYRKTLDP